MHIPEGRGGGVNAKTVDTDPESEGRSEGAGDSGQLFSLLRYLFREGVLLHVRLLMAGMMMSEVREKACVLLAS